MKRIYSIDGTGKPADNMNTLRRQFTITVMLGLFLAVVFACYASTIAQTSVAVNSPATRDFVTLPARPCPVELDSRRTAVIVVDMQNDFGAKGGMLDQAGIDITGIQKAVAPTRRALEAARRAGIRVIYLKMGFQPDLSDAGPKGSPNWNIHEAAGVGQPMNAPDGSEGRILIRDTWNTDILPELKPAPDDVVLYKTRFSGFYRTDLDGVLRRAGIKHLIITGCTTSVCVESTIRDAMFRDYSSVLLEDCAAEPLGQGLTRSNHEATLLLIQTNFGAVSSSEEFIKAVDALSSGRP